MMRRSSIEIRDKCPYCGFRFSIDARDIEGELHALRCIDCREKFLVEIVVAVSHVIDGVAGVSSDAVLDRLSASVHPGKAGAGDVGDLPDDDFAAEAEQLPEFREAGEVRLKVESVERMEPPAATERQSPPRELTADELAELQELIQWVDDSGAGEDGPAEFETVEAFETCRPCPRRRLCEARETCDREKPAPAQSGINTRPPPSMAGLARNAPTKRKGRGLKYGDR